MGLWENTNRKGWGGKGAQSKPYESRLWPDEFHPHYNHRGIDSLRLN